PQFPLQVLLDAGNFARQTAGVAFPIVHLDCARNSVTVFPHSVETLPHHREHVIPVTLQDRAHGIESVVHPALVDDVQRPGHILSHTLPLPKRRHAELQQHHGSSRHPIIARRKTPDARQPPPCAWHRMPYVCCRLSSHALGYSTLPVSLNPFTASRNRARRCSASGSVAFVSSRM